MLLLSIEKNKEILCLTEHHMKAPEMLQVNLENYTLGASYCRENIAKEGVSIFVNKNLKFKQVDITHHCNEQDIECCVMLCNWSLNSPTYMS
jgi:hypothetical protein